MVRRKFSKKDRRRRLSDEEIMFRELAKASIECGVLLFKEPTPVVKPKQECAYNYFEI